MEDSTGADRLFGGEVMGGVSRPAADAGRLDRIGGHVTPNRRPERSRPKGR
jgi:hypothetical protein